MSYQSGIGLMANLCVQRTRVKQRSALPASCPRAADAGR